MAAQICLRPSESSSDGRNPCALLTEEGCLVSVAGASSERSFLQVVKAIIGSLSDNVCPKVPLSHNTLDN